MNNEKLRADIKSALNGMPLAAMGTYAELLNRAYAALGEQQGAPAGHVMVPVEPPEAVLEILYDNGMDLDDQMLLNIWKWLLDAAPKAECTNSDSWNCKYCNKTKDCEALKDPRNFAAPKAEQPPVQEPARNPDVLALNAAREIMALVYGPTPLGGSPQLLAQIQCVVSEAIVYAAPQPVSDDAKDALVDALEQIARMTYDAWTNGAIACRIAEGALAAYRAAPAATEVSND